ncbi:hypothetical protein [Pseudoneobacillus sp. C159]
MKLVVSSIFISTSLMMFFIHSMVKNIASYFLESYEYQMIHTIFPWIPWLALIIGLYYFFSHTYEIGEIKK